MTDGGVTPDSFLWPDSTTPIDSGHAGIDSLVMADASLPISDAGIAIPDGLPSGDALFDLLCESSADCDSDECCAEILGLSVCVEGQELPNGTCVPDFF